MFHFFSCFSPLVVREEKENKQKKNIKGEKNGLARHILTEKKKKKNNLNVYELVSQKKVL
jgi:hypothetical protein